MSEPHQHEWEHGAHMAEAFGIDGRVSACAICSVTRAEAEHDSRVRLAASQPPSGDAPDLREALTVLHKDAVDPERESMWRYGVRHTLSVIESALAASAASSPATPAPLEVERLYRVIADVAWDEATSPVGPPEDGIEQHDLRTLAESIARAYANQEGGEPRKENR
jgi:hypothetical protein